MACVGTSFGFVPHLFFPNQTGSDYVVPSFEPLARHRQDFTIFSQLDHGAKRLVAIVGYAYLSGIRSKNAKGFQEGNITLDQKAAEFVGAATRYHPCNLVLGAQRAINYPGRILV